MHNEKSFCQLFVLTVTSMLFIAYNILKEQELTKRASETDTFTFQVFKKASFKLREKLKGVFCLINSDLVIVLEICKLIINLMSHDARLFPT